MPIPDDLKRIIKFPITLNKDRHDAELAAIRALPRAIPFLQPGDDVGRGSICLCVPSFQEVPNPMERRLIRMAVKVLQDYGTPFIYGRNLFPTWQKGIVLGRSSEANDIFNPVPWAVAIDRVTREAHTFGAVATFLGCEPSGDHPAVKTWKVGGLDAVRREQVIAAIMSARAQVGCGVHYCHPGGGSWNPIHFGWATRYVANPQGRITHQTYTLDDPEKFKPVPPEGYDPDKFYWSSHIGPDSVTARTLTIDKFRGMDWKAIQGAWPDMRGIVVYGGADLPWLLAELGKGE